MTASYLGASALVLVAARCSYGCLWVLAGPCVAAHRLFTGCILATNTANRKPAGIGLKESVRTATCVLSSTALRWACNTTTRHCKDFRRVCLL